MIIRGLSFPSLTSRPFHDPRQFPWVERLEAGFEAIRAEALAVCGDRSKLERYEYPGVSEERWQTFVLLHSPQLAPEWREENCARCPETRRILESLGVSFFGEVMFSVAEAGLHIKPHRDGGNFKLTCQLALSAPSEAFIRVGYETRRWQPGKTMIFDTTYEHEVQNPSGDPRIVLLSDFLHPDFTPIEQKFMTGFSRFMSHRDLPEAEGQAADEPATSCPDGARTNPPSRTPCDA